MLLVRLNSRCVARMPVISLVQGKNRGYSVPATQTRKSNEPEYPKILDMGFVAKQERLVEDWAKAVAATRTVEEKMIKINMPRYYGWNSTVLRESDITYNSVEQTEYLTRTHVPEKPGLPAYYDGIITREKLQEIVDKIKGPLEDALVFEYSNRNRSKEFTEALAKDATEVDNIMSKVLSRHVHRLLVSNLASENAHLMEMETDFDARIEAFWFAGGIPVSGSVRLSRRKSYWPKEHLDLGGDRGFQYVGTSNIQTRHKHPLPEIMPYAESEDPSLTVSEYKYDPRVLGYFKERRHGTNIPGFWPGDPSEFGMLSYHKCGHLVDRKFGDTPDALRVQAIRSSWGWLLAQACNLGFSTYNDVTYPLVNQAIITNGKWWTFSAYQMNTLLVYSRNIDENPRRNVCWMSEPMRLFEKIEDGKVHGLNTKILENLVKFYVNKPQERIGLELKPYLSVGEKLVANISGNHKRPWLEGLFKFLASNRPRHRLLPEIYDWQKIYIIKTDSRPMDKKTEPWRFGVNLWHRRLDDHCPKYIPRAVRGSKHAPKWENTYYPK